jgi:hypothetical protein
MAAAEMGKSPPITEKQLSDVSLYLPSSTASMLTAVLRARLATPSLGEADNRIPRRLSVMLQHRSR